MRRIKQWDAEITADVLTNILQPGRFAQLDQNLTIRIRERQPGGVLAGIFVDDRRDPKERVTIVADHGTVLKNESGSLSGARGRQSRALRGRQARSGAGGVRPLCLRHVEILQSAAATSRSEFANAISGSCSRRSDDDPVFKQLSGQFRAELHDRFMAPVYPFAFAVLTFAFLGTPRTTRQSRNFSIGGSILAVFGLRMAGFACSVMTVKIAVRWRSCSTRCCSAAIGVGLWMIVGGVVVEPPAALMEAINRSNARLARLFGRPATA